MERKIFYIITLHDVQEIEVIRRSRVSISDSGQIYNAPGSYAWFEFISSLNFFFGLKLNWREEKRSNFTFSFTIASSLTAHFQLQFIIVRRGEIMHNTSFVAFMGDFLQLLSLPCYLIDPE